MLNVVCEVCVLNLYLYFLKFRNKTGIWGWGSDKSEKVNTFDCKVFSATNVELVTKIRHEHLSESDKNRSENVSNFQRILNTFGATETSEFDGSGASNAVCCLIKFSPIVTITTFHCSGITQSNDALNTQGEDNAQVLREITAEEYFDKDVPLGGRDIGRPKEARTKINKFKVRLSSLELLIVIRLTL